MTAWYYLGQCFRAVAPVFVDGGGCGTHNSYPPHSSTHLQVHKDHAMAVMDIAYSPTGKEFVTGSYDRTVRIWRVDQGKSREVYHGDRMQRVFTVRFSGDAKYVLSGSDDTNVRVWKADASAKLGRLLPLERASADYRNTLKKKFAHMPEIRRIAT